jgi:hypothetical protein
MPRVWNLSDLTPTPQILQLGKAMIAPGGSGMVSSGDLRNIGLKYPSSHYWVGRSLPDEYLAARQAKAAAKEQEQEKSEETKKPSKKRKKKGSKKSGKKGK